MSTAAWFDGFFSPPERVTLRDKALGVLSVMWAIAAFCGFLLLPWIAGAAYILARLTGRAA